MKEKFFILIVAIAIVTRLVNLNQSFWLDEAAQALESKRPFLEQINIAADFHPPLYHIFLHIWMLLGTSEVWLRIPSVIMGVFCVVLIIEIARKLGYKKAALLGGLLLAISPFHIWYSQEVRPYMMFTFLSLLSTYFLLRKLWVLYVITSILALYTNYFAPFLFLSQSVYICVLDKKSLKKYITASVIIVIAFIPWLPAFLQQLAIGTSGVFQGWTEVVSVSILKVIPATLAKFIIGKASLDDKTFYVLVLLPVTIIFSYSYIILAKAKKDWAPLILFTIPLLAVTLITFIVPVAAPQRLLFILPYFTLIMAIAVERLPTKEKYFCVIVTVVTFCSGLYLYYTDVKVQREQWREAINEVNKQGNKETSLAIFAFPDPFAPFHWYSKKDGVQGIGVAPNFIYSKSEVEILREKISGRNRLFIFQYLTGLTDPDKKILEDAKKSGFQEEKILNFEGVGFIYVLGKK